MSLAELLPVLDRRLAERVESSFASYEEALREHLRHHLEASFADLSALRPPGAGLLSEEDLAPLHAAAAEAAAGAAAESRGHAVGELLAAARALDTASGQVELLCRLLEECCRFGSRAALLVATESAARGWAASGFGDSVRPLDGLLVAWQGAWQRFASGHGVVELEESDAAPLIEHLAADAPRVAIAVPLVLRDRVAAAIYVDATGDRVELDRGAIQLLVHLAAQQLEASSQRTRSRTPTLYEAGDGAEALQLWEEGADAAAPDRSTEVTAVHRLFGGPAGAEPAPAAEIEQQPAQAAVDLEPPAPAEVEEAEDAAAPIAVEGPQASPAPEPEPTIEEPAPAPPSEAAWAWDSAAPAVESAPPAEDEIAATVPEPIGDDAGVDLSAAPAAAAEDDLWAPEVEPEMVAEDAPWSAPAGDLPAPEVEESGFATVDDESLPRAAEAEVELDETGGQAAPVAGEAADLEGEPATADELWEAEPVPEPAPELAPAELAPTELASPPRQIENVDATVAVSQSLLRQYAMGLQSAPDSTAGGAAAGPAGAVTGQVQLPPLEPIEPVAEVATPEPPAAELEATDEDVSEDQTVMLRRPVEAEAPPATEAEDETNPTIARPGSQVQPPADMRGGAQVAPPSDLTGPGWAFRGRQPAAATNDPALEEARRLARLLVSEIKLYNEEQVEEGRRRRDLYSRLKEDIDRSREVYEGRIDPRALEHDFFREALVKVLAGGDSSALGM